MSDAAPSPPRRRSNPGVFAGRPLGIPLYVAPSWFVIAALLTVILAGYLTEQTDVSQQTAYAGSAAFVLLLYLSVLTHELSHCVVARLLGLPVRRIVLMLIGGVSELEREPQTAASEYLIAFAGPIVSLFLSGVGFAVSAAFAPHTLPRIIAGEVALSNGLVAAFNMLPGLPLDGGRVLRAVVWRLSSNPLSGTVAAAWCGRVLGALFAVVPIFAYAALPESSRPDPFTVIWFLIIGSFLWGGASQSLRMANIRARLPTLSVRGLLREALTVPYDLPLAEALRRAHEAGVRGLVTVDSQGRPSGVVSEAAVMATPEQRRPWIAVGSLARKVEPALTLDLELSGQAILDAIGQAPASEYLIVDPSTGAVAGVLATADVAAAVNAS